jgi:hypothetical protein
MFEVFMQSLREWNASKNERQKLQHAYLMLTVLVVIAAGVAVAFNASLAHNIMKLALLAIGTFAVNAVAWNLLQSSVFEKLSAKPAAKRK